MSKTEFMLAVHIGNMKRSDSNTIWRSQIC